ncbi:bifunctional AP-4-A phosphorylase/ADP sulfurylase [Madurella fahalii]|uniref:Bifunctional AP-4-A phosphorylase/ADP sulfurylase n=1 Tax=Madurella fahalii TaxID=1157608 RepID=A0ABQ0GQG9_9PEZI
MPASPDAMSPVKVPPNLPELVRTAFNRARASGDVNFYPTQVTILNVNSVPIQLRFSPALANKPKAPLPPSPTIAPSDASTTNSPEQKPHKKPFFDPFDKPPAAMLITRLAPSHLLVLNKFAVVPEHFILATQAFKEQTHLLERADLEVAYACIEAYHTHHQHRHQHRHRHYHDNNNNNNNKSQNDAGEDEDDGELFVFFNSGPHSGASQPHRHIQLLPVARMREGLEEVEGGGAWEVLAAGLAAAGAGTGAEDGGPLPLRGRVPFQTFAERIGPGADLRRVYLRLYRRACEAVLGAAEGGAAAEVPADGGGGGDGEDGKEGVEARISYNLAMTRDVMVVMPRLAEGEVVSVVERDGTRRVVGKLALNGTVLAGTALVKSQAEWDALRVEPEQLLEILGRIGVPSVQAPPPLDGVGRLVML